MKYLGMMVLLALSSAWAQADYQLKVFLNGEEINWQEETRAEGLLGISFAGGRLELNLSDWNTFAYAHVLATSFKKTGDTYSVSATVRHNDTGWDNYADAFEIKGDAVENGLRVLLHPHENEQPFTRSQSGVKASGWVWVEAKTNVEGWGGSKIYLNLDAFKDIDRLELRYDLKY
jgi:hypothetical protein